MYNPDLCPTSLAFLCCEGYMAVTRLTESCKGSPQSPYCPSGCEGQGEKQGRMCIYCILVYLLRALLVSEAASSALWGGFGVRAPHDGVFSSSMVQEYQTLPRFLPLLYKQLIDVPLFPLPGGCLKENLFLQLMQNHRSTLLAVLLFQMSCPACFQEQVLYLPYLSLAVSTVYRQSSSLWDDEQKTTNLLRPLLLSLSSRTMCTSGILQVQTTFSQVTHFIFSVSGPMFIKKCD